MGTFERDFTFLERFLIQREIWERFDIRGEIWERFSIKRDKVKTIERGFLVINASVRLRNARSVNPVKPCLRILHTPDEYATLFYRFGSSLTTVLG